MNTAFKSICCEGGMLIATRRSSEDRYAVMIDVVYTPTVHEIDLNAVRISNDDSLASSNVSAGGEALSQAPDEMQV